MLRYVGGVKNQIKLHLATIHSFSVYFGVLVFLVWEKMEVDWLMFFFLPLSPDAKKNQAVRGN